MSASKLRRLAGLAFALVAVFGGVSAHSVASHHAAATSSAAGYSTPSLVGDWD
jgi:hypothetical protein